MRQINFWSVGHDTHCSLKTVESPRLPSILLRPASAGLYLLLVFHLFLQNGLLRRAQGDQQSSPVRLIVVACCLSRTGLVSQASSCIRCPFIQRSPLGTRLSESLSLDGLAVGQYTKYAPGSSMIHARFTTQKTEDISQAKRI